MFCKNRMKVRYTKSYGKLLKITPSVARKMRVTALWSTELNDDYYENFNNR